MAKTREKNRKASSRTEAKNQASLEFPSVIQKHPHAIFISLLALLLIIFFNDAFFSGKVFNVPDNLSAIVFEQGYLEKADEAGVNAFWNPYIFSGMPTWGSSIPGHGMYLHTFLDPLAPKIILQVYSWAQGAINILPLPDPFWDIFNYFLLGVFTYFFGIRKKFQPFTAFLVAVSVVFTLYSLNWIMAGHNTKITVFAWLPATLLLIDLIFEKRTIFRIALLVTVLHLTFNSGHIQMVFYNLVAAGMFILYKLYDGEKVSNTAMVAGITIFAAVFAFLMLSGPYFATWEYKDFSIRGAGSGGSGHGSTSGGLDYDYATLWSFSLTEVITFFVPSFVGWGTPTYWGTMQFTESPIYLGIVVSFLALIAILLKPKDKFVHFWVALGLVALLISFGRNFGLIYDILFNNLPFFNNFRIPSMILYLEGLCMGMLAGIGLSELLQLMRERSFDKQIGIKKFTKLVWAPVGGAVLLFVIFLASEGTYKDAVAEGMEKNHPRSFQAMTQVEQAFAAGQGSQIPAEYQNLSRDGIFSMASNDALIAVLFMAAVAFLLWMFARGKLAVTLLFAGLVVLLLIDMWRADFKPMNMQAKVLQTQQLQASESVNFLQQDKSIHRVLPLGQRSGENWYVGFDIQSISGYHPAKLKYYDDIRNSIFGEWQFQDAQQLAATNWALLSMLNTKYIVAPAGFEPNIPWLKKVNEGQQEWVFENTYVLPRAFFVGKYEVIEDDEAMFNKIGTLPGYSPNNTAYLSAPLAEELPLVKDSILAGTKAELKEFGINAFEYELETAQKAVLKISEIYYPSGWTATLDGEPIDILRCDYALRAVVVPAGKHTLRMEFAPKTYTAGLIITTLTNYLLFAVLLIFGYLWWRNRFGKAPVNKATAKD
jgi:membrane protein YfhO